MDDVLDFIRAAAPWVAMGLLIAIMAVRGVSKNCKGKQADDNYGTEGMCLGMCFGTALGTSLGNNTGLGISLGMLIGLAIGTSIRKKPEANDEQDAAEEKK